MNKKYFKKIAGVLVMCIMLTFAAAGNGQVSAAPASGNSALGQICLMAFPYDPMDWVPCDGRILNINQNSALFALISNKFGGDGVTTFAIPKLNNPDVYVKYYMSITGVYPTVGGLGVDTLINQIELFPYNFVPDGWARCEGQSLNTNQYAALFSLLGYTYGGSGSSFNLPNLKGTEPNANLHYCISLMGFYPSDGDYSSGGMVDNLMGSINLYARISRFESTDGVSNGNCNGGLLNVSDDSALYGCIGTLYGGDGVSTFGKPDLRGFTPDPRLSYYIQTLGSFPQRN
jgi:microcystin-dependent protein